MYCRALACDFDGTGARDGHLDPEVAEVLAEARRLGIVTMLVTGRVLEDLRLAAVDLGAFDAVVAENGAVVQLAGLDRPIQLAAPPPERFLGQLRARGVPVQVGAVVVATWDGHTGDVIDVIRRCGIDAQLIFNRAAVMVLPSGVNKAVGVRRALAELGRSARNLIAFGDAENDLPLFADAEIGVAARNSIPSILEVADHRLTQPDATGVATYVRRLLEQGGLAPTPLRRRIRVGETAEGIDVGIPSSGANLMISGDPRAGKSWLAGLVAEQLIEHDYRLCLFDPEGDHEALGRRPAVLLLGHELALPAPEVVPRVLRDEPLSVVLNLSRLSRSAQIAYVDATLCALETTRARTGIPHWIMIDEAHYFFHDTAPCCRHFESRTGNYVFVTYRPTRIERSVCAQVSAHLVTPTAVDEERYFMTALLQAHGPFGLAASDALNQLGVGSVGLLLQHGADTSWQVFRPGPRVCPHTHHARKYVDTVLPDDKAFYFRDASTVSLAVAHSVGEFVAAVRSVPLASLARHLAAGDFSRWAEDVLGDAALARGLRKLERTVYDGGPPSRAEILHHVGACYDLGLANGARPAGGELPQPATSFTA